MYCLLQPSFSLFSITPKVSHHCCIHHSKSTTLYDRNIPWIFSSWVRTDLANLYPSCPNQLPASGQFSCLMHFYETWCFFAISGSFIAWSKVGSSWNSIATRIALFVVLHPHLTCLYIPCIAASCSWDSSIWSHIALRSLHRLYSALGIPGFST